MHLIRFAKFAVLLAVFGAFLSGCAGPVAIAPAVAEAPIHDLSRIPINLWPYGPELAEQLLRSGPIAQPNGRIVAAGRSGDRDTQVASNTAEGIAQAAMVKMVGVEKFILCPPTWGEVKKEGEEFVVTIIVTAEVTNGYGLK